jgi:hypothetical protein
MSAIFERPALAALERHAITLPDGLLDTALHEVLGRGGRDGSYFAGRVDGERDLPPATRELDRILRAELIRTLGERHGLRFTLAFLSAGDGDAPVERTFAPASMADAPRVFRVVVNLSEYPRRVLLWDGEADGEPDELLVPGRRCGAVHALHFWAAAVPHCGVNDALGHFVASYEAPAR